MANIPRSQVYLEGWEAHILGIDLNDNPYDLESQDWARIEWLLGWIEHSVAVKYLQSLERDADIRPSCSPAARSG